MKTTPSRLTSSLVITTLASAVLLGGLGAPLAFAQTCTPPPAGLVGWWSGDGHYFDLVGTNHGAPLGEAGVAAGKVGQCFSLNADGAAVTIAHNPMLDVPLTGFTAEFWMQGVKNQPQSIYLVVDKSHGWGDSTGWLFQGHSDSGRIFFGIGAGGPDINNFPLATSTTDVLDGQWHHVAGTWDGTALLIFVDGAQQAQAALTIPFNNTRPVNLGYSWGGGAPNRFFRGNVDELGIYNRALTPGEIAALYAAGSAGKCKPPFPAPAGLVSWWPAENNGFDLVGTNHAVSVGGLGFAPGRVNQAFDLDGVNAFAQVPSPAGLPLGSQPRTVALWFRTPRNLAVTTESALFQYGAESAAQMFGLITSGNAPGNLYFFGYSRDLAGTTSLESNLWYHTAVTYDGAAVTLYLNGQPEGARSVVLNTVLNAAGLTLGNRPGGAKWQGQLDEVMLFNRALSPNEIAAIHAAGSAGVGPFPARPDLTFARVGETLTLSWSSQAGVSYQLQSATHLPAAGWANEGTPFPGTGGMLSTNLPLGTEPAKFFRLQAED